MTYPQFWQTDEKPPRMLTVLGRSAIDPDCLVAECGHKKGLWIVDSAGFGIVLGLESECRAEKIGVVQ